MKKRFNLLEVLSYKKTLKDKLSKHNPITYKYKFLKFFTEELIFVGNIRNVKTVYLIPYNSKRGYFWPTKRYYPFNLLKEGRMNVVSRFIPALILYFILVALLLVSTLFIPYNQTSLLIVQYLVILAVSPLAFKGIGSRRNAASSDAQLKFAFESLEEMNSYQRNQLGFIFVDTSKRQTLIKAIVAFFKSHNKNPLLVEPGFFSGEELGVASNKFQSKYAVNLAKKYQLKSFLLEALPEYYHYQRYVMLSYGSLDKDQDFLCRQTLKNKEVLDEIQYQKMKSILLEIGNE